jgi:hypothetical protein
MKSVPISRWAIGLPPRSSELDLAGAERGTSAASPGQPRGRARWLERPGRRHSGCREVAHQPGRPRAGAEHPVRGASLEGNQTRYILPKHNSGEFALASQDAWWFHRLPDRESASEEGSPAIRPAPRYNGSDAPLLLCSEPCVAPRQDWFAGGNRLGS